ncbi:MAG: hypothetical protein AAFX05_05975, partial [Planctomycetota bacterium]
MQSVATKTRVAHEMPMIPADPTRRKSLSTAFDVVAHVVTDCTEGIRAGLAVHYSLPSANGRPKRSALDG